MLQFDIDANVRKTHGKGAARSLRREGQTPAVLYGLGNESVSLELDTRTFTKTLYEIKRRNAVISLGVKDGRKKKVTHYVMLKEVQVDPVKDTPLHADFCSIEVEKPMVLNVPIKFTGKAKGVDLGGFMNIAMSDIEISGLVMDIPDFVEIDVADLNIGDSLNCGTLPIPENVELVSDPERTCVAVVEPSRVVEEVEEEVEGEEGAEEGAAAEGGSDDQAGSDEGESSE